MINAIGQLPDSCKMLSEISMGRSNELPTVAVTVPMVDGHLACNAITLDNYSEPITDEGGFVRVVPLGNIAIMDASRRGNSEIEIDLQPIGGIAGVHAQKKRYGLHVPAQRLLLALSVPMNPADRRAELSFRDQYGEEVPFIPDADPTPEAVCEMMSFLDKIVVGGLRDSRR